MYYCRHIFPLLLVGSYMPPCDWVWSSQPYFQVWYNFEETKSLLHNSTATPKGSQITEWTKTQQNVIILLLCCILTVNWYLRFKHIVSNVAMMITIFPLKSYRWERVLGSLRTLRGKDPQPGACK